MSSAKSPNDFCSQSSAVGFDLAPNFFEPFDHFLHGQVLFHPLGDPAAPVAAELHIFLGLHVGGLHFVKRLRIAAQIGPDILDASQIGLLDVLGHVRRHEAELDHERRAFDLFRRPGGIWEAWRVVGGQVVRCQLQLS